MSVFLDNGAGREPHEYDTEVHPIVAVGEEGSHLDVLELRMRLPRDLVRLDESELFHFSVSESSPCDGGDRHHKGARLMKIGADVLPIVVRRVV